MSKHRKKVWAGSPPPRATSVSTLKARPSVEVPLGEQQRFVDMLNTGQNFDALLDARRLVRDYPKSVFSWKSLGAALLRNRQADEAEEVLLHALCQTTSDPEIYHNLGCVYARQGRIIDAEKSWETALALQPDLELSLKFLTGMLLERELFDKALVHIEKMLKIQPNNLFWLDQKAPILIKLGRFKEAQGILTRLLRTDPDNAEMLRGMGNVYYHLGLFDKGEEALRKCRALAPDNMLFFSDHLFKMHYNPSLTAQDIFQEHLEWNHRFAPRGASRAEAADRNPERRLRIGMISAGFRIHPVGQMIASALHFLPREDLELFAYTMNAECDAYTRAIQQRTDHWVLAMDLTDVQLDERIRQDKIDILVDLSGHTEGSRSAVFAMEPAPIQVKWVGGQINTTGIRAMDYMLSDSIETPPGVDELYVEKLIRLPDDYICYVPRRDMPEIRQLPAREQKFVTFGSFNNAAKLNPVLIGNWAKLLHRVEDSRLFLKGARYKSDELIERVSQQFENLGVSRERLIFEPGSPHVPLLDSYNRVDIALDTWPYSGGLTTCEALLMGVPVVSLPGPTFAGRHSATHLSNAGLSNLVAEDWDQYIAKAEALARDLETLDGYRRDLRNQLQQSPVCDAHRFGHHLNRALRAIWQRYCEHKAPAALAFDKDGTACFEDTAEPVSVRVTELPNPRAPKPAEEAAVFDWALPRQVVVMDNGAQLFREHRFEKLRGSNAFAVIGFDPASRVSNSEDLARDSNVQLFPHALLGNGTPTTLYACLDPEWSSTLPPLKSDLLSQSQRAGAIVLTTLPINTVALDVIEGIEQIDWMLLDQRSQILEVLDHGGKALRNTLILQIRVAAQPCYEGQPDSSEIIDAAAELGFHLHRLNKPLVASSRVPGQGTPDASPSETLELTFIPSHERMALLSDDQRKVLAFLAASVLDMPCLAHHVLEEMDPARAREFLLTRQATQPCEARTRPSPCPPRLEAASQQSANMPSADTPVIVLPDAPHMADTERALFRRCLANAGSYYEFGAGGSTVWAIEQGLTVEGVESDARWVDALIAKLGDHCKLEVVDIGPTGQWGMPTSNHRAERFPDYSCAIDKHRHYFDLILIDGRFRVACVMKSIEHLLRYPAEGKGGLLFIHDFWNRPHYHVVLPFLDVVERVDSAGLFRPKRDIVLAEVQQLWRDYARVPA